VDEEEKGRDDEGQVMPSKSPKQAKMMRAVAHSPKFARKVGIPVSVGKHFVAADKAKAKRKKH
jgi:hypothetical protein